MPTCGVELARVRHEPFPKGTFFPISITFGYVNPLSIILRKRATRSGWCSAIDHLTWPIPAVDTLMVSQLAETRWYAPTTFIRTSNGCNIGCFIFIVTVKMAFSIRAGVIRLILKTAVNGLFTTIVGGRIVLVDTVRVWPDALSNVDFKWRLEVVFWLKDQTVTS